MRPGFCVRKQDITRETHHPADSFIVAKSNTCVCTGRAGFVPTKNWVGFKLQSNEADEAHNMNKIILADSQAIFRAGTAKVLAMDEDLRIIAQCTDLERMLHAITTFPSSIVLFAASLRPDLGRLRAMLESVGSRGIVIAENNEAAATFIQHGFRGVVYRSVTGPALLECVRRVAEGDVWMPPQMMHVEAHDEDMVGARVRDRLTPKEMRIVALIVQGCKNREIATRLKTTEQVIKNYLRSIYDKTGVGDRLELALFTIHHRVLAQAAAEMGSKLEAEEQAVPPTAVA
jgi:DNA-binding NarL/FixJ family response regulator